MFQYFYYNINVDNTVEEVQLHCLIILICIFIAVALLQQQNIRLAFWCPQNSVKVLFLPKMNAKTSVVSLHLKHCKKKLMFGGLQQMSSVPNITMAAV